MAGAFENSSYSSEQAETAAYRSGVYALLASLLWENPGRDGLGRLIAAASGPAAGSAGRQSERAFLEAIEPLSQEDPSELRTAVASEYAELFVGPRPPLAPIYESVYLDPSERLMVDRTMQVRAFYERFGRAVERRNRIPDDHMAFEASFLADLCQREAEAWGRGDEAGARDLERGEAEFLVVHLGNWAGAFCERVAAAPCARFYRAVAAFVRDFADEDASYLIASAKRSAAPAA